MAVNPPISFSSDIRPEDTANARTTIHAALYPDEQNPWAIDFSGACPRCRDRIQIRKWLVSVAGALRINDSQMEALCRALDNEGVDRSQGDEIFDLLCSCDVDHPQRPKGKHGCGASFRVQVIWP